MELDDEPINVQSNHKYEVLIANAKLELGVTR